MPIECKIFLLHLDSRGQGSLGSGWKALAVLRWLWIGLYWLQGCCSVWPLALKWREPRHWDSKQCLNYEKLKERSDCCHHHYHCACFHHRGTTANPDSLIRTLVHSGSLASRGEPCFTGSQMIIFSLWYETSPPHPEGKVTSQRPFPSFPVPPGGEESYPLWRIPLFISEWWKKRKGERNRVGARFAPPLCPRISLCNLCNRVGDDDTISPQNDCHLGTTVIDVHPTEMGATLTDSNPSTS